MAGTVNQRFDMLVAGTAFSIPLTKAMTDALSVAYRNLVTQRDEWKARTEATPPAGHTADPNYALNKAAFESKGFNEADKTNLTAGLTAINTPWGGFVTAVNKTFAEFSQRIQLAGQYCSAMVKMGKTDPSPTAYLDILQAYNASTVTATTTITTQMVNMTTALTDLWTALDAEPITGTVTTPVISTNVAAKITACNNLVTSTGNNCKTYGATITNKVTQYTKVPQDYLTAIGAVYLANVTPLWNTDPYKGGLLREVATPAFEALL